MRADNETEFGSSAGSYAKQSKAPRSPAEKLRIAPNRERRSPALRPLAS